MVSGCNNRGYYYVCFNALYNKMKGAIGIILIIIGVLAYLVSPFLSLLLVGFGSWIIYKGLEK